MFKRIAPGLLNPAIEAIVAHERGHCWRHLLQAWGILPSGLLAIDGFRQVSDPDALLLRNMWRARREEGCVDLVGWAWTLQRNPSRYDEVGAWHVSLRAEQAVDTASHDARVWIRLAKDNVAFKPVATIFDQVGPLWQAGLLAGFQHFQPNSPSPVNPSIR